VLTSQAPDRSVPVAEDKEGSGLWPWVGKQLMKSTGVSAVAHRGAGETIGSLLAIAHPSVTKEEGLGLAKESLVSAGRDIKDVLAGKKETSFVQELEKTRPVTGASKLETQIFGLGADIALDPLNLIGGGLTKSGRIGQQAGRVLKAGDKIEKGSELARQMAKYGVEPGIAATKAEQVRKGQRALLQVGGKKVIGGEKVYEAGGKLIEKAAKTKPAQIYKKVFSTKTGNQAFDEMMQQMRSLEEFRIGREMKTGKEISKTLRKFEPEDIAKIADVIENPQLRTSMPENVLKIADELDAGFEGMKNKELARGILRDELKDYFPHVRSKESLAEKISNWWGSPKQWSDKLAAANRRNVGKFVSEFSGESVIGTADKLNLTPMFRTADGGLDSMTNLRKVLPAAELEKMTPEFYAILGKGDKIDDLFKFERSSVREINEAFGKEFFQSNPAVAYTTRGVGSAKAVTGAEFLENAKAFGLAAEKAPREFVESASSTLSGLKFEPEVARAIDAYVDRIKPDELNAFLRGFDSVQNLWKAQALVAPSYHIRNMVGNYWNNFLAGVKNPGRYAQASQTMTERGRKNFVIATSYGKKYTGDEIHELAQRLGVLDLGEYAKDIEKALDVQMTKKGLFNPLSQGNLAFKTNQAAGKFIENQARMAHFLDRIAKGDTAADAAASVKKYLFDYGDLTTAERQILKRFLPFYTWSRKNIPLQLEHLVREPEKFSAIHKIQNLIEGNVERPDERFLSDYIKDNVAFRVKKDADGNTLYFLMGNWLPAAQALDFLTQPVENVKFMLSPVFKVPVELYSNKSMFFKDTLGEASDIERYPYEQGTFLGISMRRKVQNLLRNIRLLNEIDKLNPGEVFGTPTEESLWSKQFGEQSVSLPFGVGPVSTAQQRGSSYTPETTQGTRVLQSLFGKVQAYDPQQSAQFYQWDTEGRISELTRAISQARNKGQEAYARQLEEELKNFEASRFEVPGQSSSTSRLQSRPSRTSRVRSRR